VARAVAAAYLASTSAAHPASNRAQARSTQRNSPGEPSRWRVAEASVA
jgi:hypothetical protein